MAKPKPAKDKSAKAEKPKRETAAKAKPPKSPKKGKQKEPLSHEERKKAAWLRKTERRAAQQTVAEVGAQASAGLTFDQLENPGLAARRSKPVGPTFEQTLLEVVAEQAQQFEESAELVHLPWDGLEPEIRIVFGDKEIFDNATVDDIVEPIGDAATCKVVMDEIRRLLEKTGLVFNAFRESGALAAQLAAEEVFGKEPESPLGLRLAEIILADAPDMAVEDFLEEVYDRIQELQIVSSSLDPERELGKSTRLGLIDEAAADRLKKSAAEEAIRLDLAQRLAGLLTASTTPAEVDETFATLIAEAAQAAEDKRRERAAFRQTLSQRLRQKKEREGRRFSKSSEESGDEEFIQFLLAHRGDLAAVRNSLPFHLREQVEILLKDDERKGPVRREIAMVSEAANRLWTGLKTSLAAGAGKPETAVAQNAAAMRDLLGDLAQIRAFHQQLEALG